MGILKGIIDRFRAMGKTEKEISGIIETAADKATANPDVTKPEKQREPEMENRKNTNNWRKMHGLPMRRKQKARKKHERGKGADGH